MHACRTCRLLHARPGGAWRGGRGGGDGGEGGVRLETFQDQRVAHSVHGDGDRPVAVQRLPIGLSMDDTPRQGYEPSLHSHPNW